MSAAIFIKGGTNEATRNLRKEYAQLMRLAESYQGEFNDETSKRNRFSSDKDLEKYKKLLQTYYKFAEIYENVIRYIYLDSEFYITVGSGHLLGWDTYNFWNNLKAKKVIDNLTVQIHSEKLTQNQNFRNLKHPEDVDPFLNVTLEDLLNLSQTKYVCFSFLDVKSLPFKTSEGEKDKSKGIIIKNEKSIPSSQFSLTVMKTHTTLLGLALKLRARQFSFHHREAKNPFLGRSFYIPNGKKSLVIDNDQIVMLAHKDILVKLGEAIKPHLKISINPLYRLK